MITILDDNKAIAGCRFSQALWTAFSDLEGPRKWRKQGGYRFVPSGHNIEIVRAATGFAVVDLRERDDGDRPKRAPYRELTSSYQHQIEAAEAMAGKRRFALFMEQGTGKTKSAIDACGRWYAEGLIDSVLIIAPKGVDRQWIESQFPEHCGMQYAAAYWDGKNKADEIMFAPGVLNAFAIGYEAVKTRRGGAYVDEWINGAGRYALVLDESHFVKNANSLRWKACNKIRARARCTATLLCTGTPIAKNLIDEWSQLKLLDREILGIQYVTMFKSEYCLMGGFEGRQVIGPRNLDRFKSKTAPFVFRRRKDGLNIPPKVYSQFVFSMSPRQKAIYKDMARRLIAEIDEGEYATAANAMVALSELQKISNGFTYVSDEHGGHVKPLFEKPEDNPRIAALLDYLNSQESGGKVLIWCRFLTDVDLVSFALMDSAGRKPNVVTMDSRVRARAREEAIERWLNKHPEPRFLIATAGTGGTGLNLQGRCNSVIYFSNSENSIQRWQSEDRTHRIGTRHSINYVDLIADGSRDRAILRNLKRKKDLSDMRLDDIRSDLIEAMEF